jgi:hypothetical protein
MKNITLKPVHYAKIAALALTVFWVLTFNQRIQVLGEAGVELKFTDMTMVKYLLGLSYSAEEMEMIVKLRDWASS